MVDPVITAAIVVLSGITSVATVAGSLAWWLSAQFSAVRLLVYENREQHRVALDANAKEMREAIDAHEHVDQTRHQDNLVAIGAINANLAALRSRENNGHGDWHS